MVRTGQPRGLGLGRARGGTARESNREGGVGDGVWFGEGSAQATDYVP